MQPYQHCLVSVDLSDESTKLIQKAQNLAAIHGATLHLVHVVDYTPSLYASSEIALPIDLDSMDHALFEDVKADLSQLATKCNIESQNCWLLSGEKEHEIMQLVEKITCDLLIVGAHDKHGLARLFNSTAETLLHAMPCDMLTIKINSAEE